MFAFEVITVDVAGKEIAREPGNATYFRENWGDVVTLDMVWIRGASFKMGARTREESASDDEFPQCQVNVKKKLDGKICGHTSSMEKGCKFISSEY